MYGEIVIFGCLHLPGIWALSFFFLIYSFSTMIVRMVNFARNKEYGGVKMQTLIILLAVVVLTVIYFIDPEKPYIYLS